MKLKGLKGVLKEIDRVGGEIARGTQDEISATALDIEAQATRDAPDVYKYDGGGKQKTNNEITQSIAAKRDGKYHWNVTVNSTMAAYAEFGTGAFVDIEKGWEDIAMSYYVSGKGIMLPQPFFIPAYNKHSKLLIANIEKVIERATR